VEASGQVALDHAAEQQCSDDDPGGGPEGSDLALSNGWKVGVGCCHCAHLVVSRDSSW